jgi:3'5'-cyclic nucleotide phosphodiesterase
MLYNDDVVLERHHTATTHRLVARPELHFISGLRQANKILFRRQVTAAIMATDMGRHFQCVDEMRKLSTKEVPFDKTDPNARCVLMQYVLHSAGKLMKSIAGEVILTTQSLIALFISRVSIHRW